MSETDANMQDDNERLVEDEQDFDSEATNRSPIVNEAVYEAAINLLKRQSQQRDTASRALSSTSEAPYPDSRDLAALFYEEAKGVVQRQTAAQVALHSHLADEIAEYVRAEQLASAYRPEAQASTGVPPAAWNLIYEWEEQELATTKTESERGREDMMARLSQILNAKKDELRELARESHPLGKEHQTETVSVIVVSHAVEFRGVEVFEKVPDEEGASVLKHIEQSDKFDSKPVHVLLDFGEEHPIVVSEFIHRDTIRLQRILRPNSRLQRADFFIIEE